VSTVLALIALVLVVRFLPPSGRVAQATAPAAHVAAAPTDLTLGEMQLNRPSGSEIVYLDGMITNSGKGVISGATAQVDFLDASGKLVASTEEPLVGMAQGGVGVVGNEFARHPVLPGEARFFRVAVKNAPPLWNHEVPHLKIVTVKSPQ
jgi:hypothetical protein